MEEPGYWDDSERSASGMKELKELKADVDCFQHLSQLYEEIDTLILMGDEEKDLSLLQEVKDELVNLTNKC